MTPDFAHMTVADALRYAANKLTREADALDELYMPGRAECLREIANGFKRDARRAEQQKARPI